MMVAAKHYGGRDFSAGYRVIERLGYLGAAFRVGVENAGL